ncbi:MAG: hypothetical protein JNL32_02545 [Candidatus Kapabacteria bacterium]|nr:hypothetical protein [Candidatus Kapabacteria bacterium]
MKRALSYLHNIFNARISLAYIITGMFTLTSVQAQQIKLAAIMPDIAAPGMKVYMEFLSTIDGNTIGAPFSANDGIYAGADNSFKIEFLRPTDSTLITFSPLSTSWDGRLLSCIAYINPAMPTPNSTDWAQLNSQFVIPVRIVNRGDVSNYDTIYLVRPTPIGDMRTASESVIGAGSLGRRSKRGAMIVNWINFGTRTYTVSTSDPDNNASNGNQGYLPLILMATDSIHGEGTTSIISVSANGLNGGPGGGGGGGEYCDNVLSTTPGTRGGDGFTGGARGGRNAIIGGGGSYQAHGTGTGPNGSNGQGNSLTNAIGAAVTTGYQSGGGGTGHPFGISGAQCVVGNCELQGAQGGASGVKDATDGAGGGYGTEGGSTSGSMTILNGGRIHGNRMTVPIAGGSGGGGGNPLGNCGGRGGGGGGAIRIISPMITNLRIEANGADGTRGATVAVSGQLGGSGSGGHISLMAYNELNNIGLSAVGGGLATAGRGGTGRIRVDGMFTLPSSSTPSVNYNGVTMDRIDSALSLSFPIGGRASNGDSINIWLKDGRTAWRSIGGTRAGSDNRWTFTVDYTSGTTDYVYLCAVHVVDPLQTSNTTPPYILSPLGAAAVRIARTQSVIAPATLNMGSVSCETNGGVKHDTITIQNTGTSDVTIVSGRFQNGTVGFGFPTGYTIAGQTVRTGLTLRIPIQYTVQPNIFGAQTDDLIINYPAGTSPSFSRTTCSIRVDSVGIALLDTNSSQQIIINSINLNDVCRFSGKTLLYRFRNVGVTTVTIQSVQPKQPGVIVVPALPKNTLAPNESVLLTLNAATQTTGTINDSLIIQIDKCNLRYAIPITGRIIETDIEGSAPQGQAYGDVRLNTLVSKTFEVINTKNTPADIQTIPTVRPPFRLVQLAPDSVPRILTTGQKFLFNIEFQPSVAGDYYDTVRVYSTLTTSSCPDTVTFFLSGRGTQSNIVANKPILDFDTVYSCGVHRDTVWLKNSGNSTAFVYSPARITGTDSAFFRIIQQPTADSTQLLRNGLDSVPYIIEFIPDTSVNKGIRSASLVVRGRDDTLRTINVVLTAYQQRLKLVFERNGSRISSTNPLVISDVPVNSQPPFRVSIDAFNIGDVRGCISATRSQNPTVVSPLIPVINIDPQGGRSLSFDLRPTSLAPINDTITLYLNCPCTDSIKIPMTIIPTNNVLVIEPDSVAFGNVAPCVNPARQFVTLRNVDAASAARIDTLRLVGPNINAFQLSVRFALPYTLNSGIATTSDVEVGYSGAGLTAGRKVAYMEVSYVINNVRVKDTLVISANRILPIRSNPDSLDFGDIKQGQSRTMSLNITNDSSRSIVTSFGFARTTKGYFSPNITNPLIAPRATDSATVQFATDAIGEHFDTLYIKFTNPTLGCTDSMPVMLRGNIIPGLNYRVWLQRVLNFDPRTRDTVIGIYGKLDTTNLSIPRGQFRASIDMPSDMIMPTGVTARGGRISSFDYVLNGRRMITITVDTTINPIAGDTALLAQLRVDAMLADTECDSIILANFEWTNTGTRPTTWVNKSEAGSAVCLNICKEGGNRLLAQAPTAFQLFVSPNPASDFVDLTAYTTESGQHEIIMTNLIGVQVAQYQFNVTGPSEQRIRHNIQSYSAGIYYVELRSPTQRKLEALTIRR